MEAFEIVVNKWRERTLYKIRVYITHRSDQVIRFRLCAGEKVMELEKRLLEKRNPWKITDHNFKIYNSQQDTMTLKYIILNLEEYLNPLQPRGPHWKNDFDIK